MPTTEPMLLFDFPDPTGRRRPLRFADPVELIVARTLDEVRPALRAVQRAVDAGYYAAGYLAYEAAPAFDPALQVQPGTDLPLLWFGIFREPCAAAPEPEESTFQLSSWQPNVSQTAYRRNIAAIREAIAQGETYQTNYTLRLRAAFSGDDWAFYRRLRAAQRADYCAYLNLGRFRVLSASPELFFHWRESQIVARPMKGTAKRGRWLAEDQAWAAWLAASEKNRAENLMIVDLLRNDLGRIAAVGSVHVPQLFAIERYPTLFQMTSMVAADCRPATTLDDIFAALFPCGSITGAPKASTMNLIARLEDSPRGVYCGVIGFVTPQREAIFNVAIRTVVIDAQTGAAEYGVGGGITWDSTPEDEYAEALTKAALLSEPAPSFALLETLRLHQGTYTLLDRHLDRLAESARYFDIPLALPAARAALDEHRDQWPQDSRRVRLLVAQNGAITVESAPLAQQPSEQLPIALAVTPISRHDRWLFHKTTCRAIYEQRRRQQPDVFDVLLWNEEGELTEFTIGNLVLELDGVCWTPPRESGLLGGTFRAELLDRGIIHERVLTRADLMQAERIWLINSVREWVAVYVMHAQAEPELLLEAADVH
ncbi:MAG TPA: aminodeoxychorismate synthase component I [Herpetosiphonaceae bacterium]